MRFQPKFCPRPDCASHSGSPFLYRRRGRYTRRCDTRQVERFLCLTCSRGFSSQTFRLDYRLKRPDLLVPFYLDRVSKVTHRQSARNHRCSRTTEQRHFRLLAKHCTDFHAAKLEEVRKLGGLGESFSLDELESFERRRIRMPLTAPILAEKSSSFVVDIRVGTLASREKLGKAKTEEERRARRKSESRKVVKQALERLLDFAPKDQPICLITDRKHSYVSIVREVFGTRCEHVRVSSKQVRDTTNPLFLINHTEAMVRDNVSRLVRRNWAASKLLKWLLGHFAIWITYRNYVRDRVNHEPGVTPAMKLGLETTPWTVERLLKFRVFPALISPDLAQR